MSREKELTGEIGGLFDAPKLRKARAAAEEKGKDWSSNDIDWLRKKCKNDLFFLCHGPLEYVDLDEKFHGDLTNWIQKTRNLHFDTVYCGSEVEELLFKRNKQFLAFLRFGAGFCLKSRV